MNNMEINLNLYFVEGIIKNNRFEDVEIKLPLSEESLKHSLINKKIITEELVEYQNFDIPTRSVIAIKKVDNIILTPPTNIYYLNLYLNLLKEKNIYLPSEKLKLTTEILQEKIADLIEAKNKSMNYDEIKEFIARKKKEQEAKSEQIKAEQEAKAEQTKQVTKNTKPRFSIQELQKRHMERKGSNEE